MSEFIPIVFAFGPGNNSYYINNGRDTSWHNIPADLVILLETDASFSVDQILSVQLFPDEGYFVRSKTQTAFMNVPEYINQRALSSGGMEYITHIEYDASSPARYICSTTNREPGIWTTLSASLPSELVDVVVGNMDRRIEWCRLGFEAEWVCMVDKHLFKDTLVIPLQDALKNGQNVRNVVLNPYERGSFFVDYKDGSNIFEVKDEWKEDVGRVAGQRIAAKTTRKVALSSIDPDGDLRRRSLMIPRPIQRRASAENHRPANVQILAPIKMASMLGYSSTPSSPRMHVTTQEEDQSFIPVTPPTRIPSSPILMSSPSRNVFKPLGGPPLLDERSPATRIPVLPLKGPIPLSPRSPTSFVMQGPPVHLPNKRSPVLVRSSTAPSGPLVKPIYFSGNPRPCPPGASKIGRLQNGVGTRTEKSDDIAGNGGMVEEPKHLSTPSEDVFGVPEVDVSEEIDQLKLQEVNFIQQYDSN